jgi:cytochrome c oxidase cbb3-type subunit 2
MGPKGEPLPYSAAWHHRHLYDPRSVNGYSIMPSFRFLYEKRKVVGERSADALQFNGVGGPGEGYEIVPTYDAHALVAYLMSLDQSHELKEVKSAAPASPPAPGKAVK